MMKKVVAMFLLVALLCGVFFGCARENIMHNTEIPNDLRNEEGIHCATIDDITEVPVGSTDRIAMIEDFNEFYNRAIHETCLAFAEANDVDYNRYQPECDDAHSRIICMELAVSDGYNVIVLPGYSFAEPLVEVAPKYPDVKFVALDVTIEDFQTIDISDMGIYIDYCPNDGSIEGNIDLSNVCCCEFREEQAGFLAGYAAVKMGYTVMGFAGGLEIPAVIRYGYGFLQGVDMAATELGTSVTVHYGYCNLYYGTTELNETMKQWYSDGVQIIFACGGPAYEFVANTVLEYGGKMRGIHRKCGSGWSGLACWELDRQVTTSKVDH